jgi:hypothetical protein
MASAPADAAAADAFAEVTPQIFTRTRRVSITEESRIFQQFKGRGWYQKIQSE